MPISGPPRSSFTLFGGPGIILVLLAVLAIGAAAIYLRESGRLRHSGGASLSLPGDLGHVPAAKPAAEADQSQDDASAFLQPMKPMADMGGAPGTEPAKARPPAITEDLSPIDLLVKYTPKPGLALDEDGAGLPAEAGDARRYRRPSTAPADAKRLALVVTGLGLDRALTAQTILATPPDVTLSFDTDSEDLEAWIAAARAYGHEALIDLELGAIDGRAARPTDLGGKRLLPELGREENLRRLEALLARAPKAAGVTVAITGSFLADAEALTPILSRLQSGGYIVVGLPITAPLTIAPDRVLGDAMSTDALAREAVALRVLARRQGAALALSPAGNAVALADDWTRAASGSAEFALVPASALVEN